MRNNLAFFDFPECEGENRDDIKLKLRELFAKDVNRTSGTRNVQETSWKDSTSYLTNTWYWEVPRNSREENQLCS